MTKIVQTRPRMQVGGGAGRVPDLGEPPAAGDVSVGVGYGSHSSGWSSPASRRSAR